MANTRYEIKRVGVFSAVKTLFLLGGLGGFLLGIVQWASLWVMYGVIRGLPDAAGMASAFEIETLLGGVAGAGGMMFPLFGGFVGSIAGVIAAIVLGGSYNFAARLWGGLEFEGDEVKPSAVVLAPIRASTPPGEATPLPTVFPVDQRPHASDDSRPEPETRRDDGDDDSDSPRWSSSSTYE